MAPLAPSSAGPSISDTEAKATLSPVTLGVFLFLWAHENQPDSVQLDGKHWCGGSQTPTRVTPSLQGPQRDHPGSGGVKAASFRRSASAQATGLLPSFLSSSPHTPCPRTDSLGLGKVLDNLLRRGICAPPGSFLFPALWCQDRKARNDPKTITGLTSCISQNH